MTIKEAILRSLEDLKALSSNKDDWDVIAKKLQDAKVKFIIEPSGRFIGEAGEQYTMFFTDPSGNPIEIKGFNDLSAVYDS